MQGFSISKYPFNFLACLPKEIALRIKIKKALMYQEYDNPHFYKVKGQT